MEHSSWADLMSPLSYWEQQWICIVRRLLGVKAPTRRSGMGRRRSVLDRTPSTLQDVIQRYGLPDVGEDTYSRWAQSLKERSSDDRYIIHAVDTAVIILDRFCV